MDLGAEKLIAIEKNGENIAVDIQNFHSRHGLSHT
jgi:hypothetical protein